MRLRLYSVIRDKTTPPPYLFIALAVIGTIGQHNKFFQIWYFPHKTLTVRSPSKVKPHMKPQISPTSSKIEA